MGLCLHFCVRRDGGVSFSGRRKPPVILLQTETIRAVARLSSEA